MSPGTNALIILHFRLPSRILIATQDRTNLLFNPSPWLVLAHLRHYEIARKIFGILGTCPTAFPLCFLHALFITEASDNYLTQIMQGTKDLK